MTLVKIWDLDDYSCICAIHLGSGWFAVNELVSNEDATRMACTGGGSRIRIFSFPEGKCLGRHLEHKQKIQTLSFAPDVETLASGASDRMLRLWNVAQS